MSRKLTKSELRMIEDIMENFDFHKVHQTTNALNWKWQGEYITLQMLKITARQMLNGACMSDTDVHATGGFVARREFDEKGTTEYLELSFQVARWDESIGENDGF